MDWRFYSAMKLIFLLGLRSFVLLKILGGSYPNYKFMMLVAVGEGIICSSKRIIFKSVLRGISSDYIFLVYLRLAMGFTVSTSIDKPLDLGYSSIS